jgi:hypothetical protein
MTTQPATRHGDAPPLTVAWRRSTAIRQAQAATRQAVTPTQQRRAAMRQLAAACDALRAAVARRRHKGDLIATATYVAAHLTHLAHDIDRRPS